jgi:hypothetical protein
VKITLPKKFLAKRAKGKYKNTYHAIHAPGKVPGFSWLVVNADTSNVEASYTSGHQAAITAENLNREKTYKNPVKRSKKKPVSTRRKRAVRSTNPVPLLYIITAKGTGKKMHFDGKKFSERARVVTFKTVSDAQKKAQALLRAYPVLRGYRVAVEHNQHPLRGGTGLKT